MNRAARLLTRLLTRLPARPYTIRLGPVELTIRLNASRGCCACSTRGWFYTKTGIDPTPMPEGYDGVALCGCGASIARLADDHRVVCQAMKESPF